MIRRGFATAVACAVPVLLTLVLSGCDTSQTTEAGAIETTEPSAIETTEPSAMETTEPSAIKTTEPGVSPSGTTTPSGFLSTTQPSTSAAGASTSAAGPSTTPNTAWPRSDALDAQFLIQATFGPTHSSLAELKGKDSYEGWILEQMEFDASLLRSYYRSRVNPSAWQKDSIARSPIPRSPCEVGSRWSNVAFDLRDVGLQVVATGNEIFVDGQLRSKLDPQLLKNGLPAPTSCTNEKRSWWTTQECATSVRHWTCGASTSWSQDLTCQQSCWDGGYPYPGDDCSVGWRNFIFTGYLCSVPEAAEVGDIMTMSTSSDCSSFVVMRIPAMWMDSMTDTDSTRFAMVRPNIIILTSSPASCAFGEWLQVNGSAYRHDLRYKLLDTSSADQELCVAVPSTIFNLEQCKVLAGRVCDVAQASSASLNLTATTSEQLSSSGRYIYEISGLRTTASPCGTLSRWKLCSGCTASTLDAGDRSLIVNALESKEGDLRDIFVNCNSVSANAVVSLSDNKLFQHVHLQEGNVYDFTTWVTEHPGGQTAITKWTSGYKLQYPSNHPMDRFETHLSRLQYIGKSGETIRYGSLPSTVKSDTLALQLSNISSSQTFTLGCPSPGETANAPREGHNAHFFTRAEQGSNGVQEADVEFDSPSRERETRDLSRSRMNMWMGQVMSANDQLRQRMAWALSQILVVGTGGFGHTRQTELWLNYYDILVRKAFGNYLDLLKEVTFSPLMGEYLSFLRNSAFDHDQNYPDENYAREVMQLFTIGTVQLTPEGSIKLDSEGSPIPNYNNEDIMTFARVFTGLDRQVPRRNLEEVLSSNGRNIIDPMQMIAKWHDNYPKQDLDKNYLGDGLPPCADLPKGSFLMKGARYEFTSSYSGSGVLQLQADSPLYQALCGSSGVCSFQPLVILQQDLTCSGNECHTIRPSVVELSGQGVFFEYVLPRCMHFYFFEGRIATGGGDRRFWDSKRVCSNPETPQGGSYCCAGCSNIAPQWMLDANSNCETQSQATFEREDRCAGNSYWTTERFCEKSCFEADNGYGNNCSVEGSYREDHVCGLDEELVSFAAAEKNCNDIGMKICDRMTASSKCNYNSNTAQVWTLETCSVNASIDSEGKVASYHTDKTKMNKVSVNWIDGALDVKSCPSTCTTLTESCLCPMHVETQAVFNRVPDASELSQLKVGAFKPNMECNSCGEVKAYFSGSIDANTIFEYEGKYFRNMRSVVFVGGKSFRNPPVIGDDVEHTAASATQEIEALLEHLVYHPNTAPFLSFRLIQRFGTSSPSIAYVRDVATAFRTGRYGRIYSGQYGDLAATVAAILLHPEARDASAASSASSTIGALREPLVKLVHFLRAMEFEDTKERDLLFQSMQGRIGQEPFASPTVFNFYMPDYELPSGQIAPEFQIFESASLVNFLNGMFSLIDHQGVTDCNFGFGVRTDSCDYSTGSLKLKLSTTNSTDALNDLDLLLTGSRLSTHEREAVMNYTQQKGDVKAIQEAVVLTPAFQTVGAPKPMGPRAAETQTATTRAPRSYKAVVNLYLGGGADTFNLVVPINCALHDEYVAVRGEAALGNTKLLEISSSQACQSFGLHYKLPKLRELYQAGEAAFVSNIGALVQPLTKHEYRSGSKPTCVGLFSHSDQTSAAQTLKCQVAGASPKGVGGRMADVLAAGSQKFSTSSFSLKGKKTWSEGFTVVQQAVDGSGDVRTLEKYAERRPLIENLTKEELANIYSEEYSKNLGKMIDNAEVLSGQLANVTLSTTWPVPQTWSDGVLLKQFQAVSKLIASSATRKVEREFFYVELGGFDTHNDFEAIDDLFAKIDESLDSFVKELKAQGVFDSVVLVTTSDFGRTLTSNGKGTDHGWAGNHFVLGGKVKGGEIYNQFPSSLLEGNLYDVGRGRLIPKYPWESVMLPIAEWMGVDTQDRNTVFPNLPNFNSSMLLATSALFST